MYQSASSRYRHRPFGVEGDDPLRLYYQQQNSLVDDSDSDGEDGSKHEPDHHDGSTMSDPLNANGGGAEDDLDALLAQADSMISAASEGIVIDGFAIDSDEENEASNNDGIVDVNIDDSPAKAAPAGDPLLHPLHEDVLVQAPTMPPQQHQQQQQQGQPQSAPSSGNLPTTNFASMTSAMRNMNLNLGSGAAVSSMSATSQEFANQFKAQTSGFAANLSSMAQRVASVASGNTPTGGPNHMHPSFGGGGDPNQNYNNYPAPMSVNPQQQQQQQKSQNNSPYASQSNSMHGNGMNGNAPTAQPMMNFELDNDQKTKLVEIHAGGSLLPGERVIMFLHSLLHVSDSTGFQYAAGTGGSPIIWCCAMTYYRIMLFGTTQDMILYVVKSVQNNNNSATPETTKIEKPPLFQHPFHAPQQWNTSCWPPAFPTLMQMPLATMEKCEKTVYTASTQPASPAQGGRPTTLMGLQIWAKDGRFWRFTTPSYADTLRAHQALLTYAFPGRRNLGYLFAFESKRADVVNSVVTDPTTGQKTVTLALNRRRFEPVTEFTRQFQKYSSTSKIQPWKIWTNLNAQYQLCASYPSVLVGPASLDEGNPDAVRLIQNCAAFRSEQRLPALAWASGMDGASIWRCSQPKIGLQGNRSPADELVLKHIMEAAKSANALREQPLPVRMDAHLLQAFTGATGDLVNTHWVKESNAALKILDLRPKSAAMANRTGGYGYENTSNYPGATLQFCNIGNIHAVRDAYQKMTALCLNQSNATDVTWGSALEDTKWLSHIRIILAAAWETAFWVQVHRMPVLLHCSHGWDRTSQVSALAQLLLDPYYRTLEGFACLMEKDFLSFGHPFHTRCAHGEGKGGPGAGSGGGHRRQDGAPGGMPSNEPNAVDEGQISPIFLQFLDCVWQMVQQFPECFEFTTDYMLELSDHIYSCRFGNMLCDTERERELVAGIRQRTYSVWDYLDQSPIDNPEAKKWRNPTYDPSPTAGGGVLLMPMPTLLRNVTLWKERYARYGPKATLRWRNHAEEAQQL